MEITSNRIRWALTLSALVVSLSIGYYFVIVLPSERHIADLRDAADRTFQKELQCRGEYDKLEKRFHNVVGISYDLFANTCVVTYTDDEGTLRKTALADLVRVTAADK